METVEQLAFVLVDPLHLHVKDGVHVDLDAVLGLDEVGQHVLVALLDVHQPL